MFGRYDTNHAKCHYRLGNIVQRAFPQTLISRCEISASPVHKYEGLNCRLNELLAKEADEYYETSGARVNAVVNQAEAISIGPSAPIDTDLADSQNVFAISGRGSYAPRGARGGFGSRGRGGSRGRNQFRRRPAPKPVTFCHYHAQFGANARQCLQPCDFHSTLLAKSVQEQQQPQGNGPAGRW